jgi:hypothetical protein
MADFTPLQADALVARLLDPREIYEDMGGNDPDTYYRTIDSCDRLRSNLRTNRRISFLMPSERAILDHIVGTASPEDRRVLKNAAERIATIPVEG